MTASEPGLKRMAATSGLSKSFSAPGVLAPVRRPGRSQPRGHAIRNSRALHDATQDYAVRSGVNELLREVMEARRGRLARPSWHTRR